jgi:hypothetical protein
VENVEVRYAGVGIGRSTPLRDGSEAGAFVGFAEPMPTGTPLVLKGDGIEQPARVVQSIESADVSVAGMRVEFTGAAEAAAPAQPAPARPAPAQPVTAQPASAQPVSTEPAIAEPAAPIAAPPVVPVAVAAPAASAPPERAASSETPQVGGSPDAEAVESGETAGPAESAAAPAAPNSNEGDAGAGGGSGKRRRRRR